MHPAWKPRGPEWVTLAPGVQWYLRPLTGDLQARVTAQVARMLSGAEETRAALEAMGFEADEMGALGDLDVLAGFSTMLAACLYADELLEAWRGLDDAETGEPVDVSPEAIRAALRLGTPEGGPALLRPFMAWLETPRVPIAAECRRLHALAKWEQGGGREHCEGCDLMGDECAKGGTNAGDRCPRRENRPQTEPGIAAFTASRRPGIWKRAGMAGQIVGLDYATCLALASGEAGDARRYLDEGALFRCLGAIEAGALEAEIEKAKAAAGGGT